MQSGSQSSRIAGHTPRPDATFRSRQAPILFARSSALQPFLSFLKAIGAPVDRWVQQAGLPASALADAEGLIPLSAAYRFTELAARKGRMEDLGMVVGSKTSAFELGLFGKALEATETVYDYLQTGVRLADSLSSGGTRFWLSTEGDVIRINQRLAGPAGRGRCIADIYTLVVTLNTLRQLIDQAWNPGEIRLLAGDEALLGDRHFFGDAVIVPNQRHSSFTLPRSATKLPVRNNEVFGSPAAALALPGVADPMPADFRASVEQLIESLAGEDFPDIHETAHAAGMSPRTLQRRLQQAGTSYLQVVTGTRIGLARHWLTASDLPVADISAMLGYTDASNFTRAFRRETGISPREYRLRQLSD